MTDKQSILMALRISPRQAYIMLLVTVFLWVVSIMVSKGTWHTIASLDFNNGDLLVILATVGYAVYAINIRKMPKIQGIFSSNIKGSNRILRA